MGLNCSIVCSSTSLFSRNVVIIAINVSLVNCFNNSVVSSNFCRVSGLVKAKFNRSNKNINSIFPRILFLALNKPEKPSSSKSIEALLNTSFIISILVFEYLERKSKKYFKDVCFKFLNKSSPSFSFILSMLIFLPNRSALSIN